MRDEDKPFICYRRGWWYMKIVPRGVAGWKAMALWLLAMVPGAALFSLAIANKPSHGAEMTAIILFTLFMLVWAVAMIRWMLARSEMVDLQELMEIKRKLDAEKRRGR